MYNIRSIYLAVLGTLILMTSCDPSGSKTGELPILGHRYAEERQVEGRSVMDTVYHQIADFSFVNQDGEQVTNETVAGKVYVADFFFTSCPTICPIMKTEMLRVYERFGDHPDFKILSHSIDPTYDSVALLKDYSERLGIENADTWHFLTGDQEHVFEIGQTSYMSTAMEDKLEPGGFLHSGAFILVDQKGHIRGIYDGTKSDQVNRLMNDIPKLLSAQHEK